MKIDRTKLKRSSSEVPSDCRILIEKLKGCSDETDLLRELKSIKTWNYGKSELYHWIDVLDLFDSILEKGVSKERETQWSLPCDDPNSSRDGENLKELLIHVVVFTSLLIEHSFSRHLYNSMEHLTTLLSSSDMQIVLAVLNLLYVFSKRSNFITRLNSDRRQALIQRLNYLAESWGGKENGFGLAECCQDLAMTSFPSSATNLHFEFYSDESPTNTTTQCSLPGTSKAPEFTTSTPIKGKTGPCPSTLLTIHVDSVDQIRDKTVAQIMEELVSLHGIPKNKQMLLFTHLRLAHSFSTYKKRLQSVQARLQALSIIVYCNAMSVAESNNNILYNGFIEELVDVLELKNNRLLDIKAAALRTLTSVIHLDHSSKLSTIIDVTGAASYHGFLPSLVRSCIQALIDGNTESFPLPFATALFSFLYHLASYENGGEALVSCGMIESLLKVIGWKGSDPEHITFVTRAVRVIDLITNLDMGAFQTHNGLSIFINRLESEVDVCRAEQPFVIDVPVSGRFKEVQDEDALEATVMSVSEAGMTTSVSEADEKATPMEVDSSSPKPPAGPSSSCTAVGTSLPMTPSKDVQCYAQRAALLKSMLNFLKKAIQDSAFSDSIRHLMDGSLPNSLRHIISNAEYYGPTLFMLATDVVTVYVFQEPSLLSTLQESGLTDIVLQALLSKDIPPTREVISSLPNVFTALCLNTRGLDAFRACKPFDKVFKVLLSLEYLPAMRRRRSSEPLGDTASNLGTSMDELMRHQPSLRADATTAIINLLQELCNLGSNPRYICSKSSSSSKTVGDSRTTGTGTGTDGPAHHHQVQTTDGGSSDEEADEDEEDGATNDATPAASDPSASQSTSGTVDSSASTSNAVNVPQTSQPLTQAVPGTSTSSSSEEKLQPIPLVDYIVNVMRFVDSILSNNSTDDHCREFVKQKGLTPLLKILLLPNLPIDFPVSQACLSVAQVSKSILTLAHERQVLNEGLTHLSEVLAELQPLHKSLDPPGGSVLLEELIEATRQASSGTDPLSSATLTPLTHAMSAAHAMIVMFVHVCRTGQSDVRNLSVTHWGSDLGIGVLTKLSELYTSLVWESTVLHALCSESTSNVSWQFGRHQVDRLASLTKDASTNTTANTASASTAVTPTGLSNQSSTEEANTNPVNSMEVDDPDGLEPIPSRRSAVVLKAGKPSKSSKLTPQAKQIKILLCNASRLGRALAELFGLLVKLCVGTPIRHRRAHHSVQNLPMPPSPPARAIAVSLTKLLARGLSWVPPPTSPIPKFRLTFYICSVGFTSPMLFDERKFPYHLMLQQFVKYGGQDAFFESFKWALTQGGKVSIEEGIEHPDLPEGTGEFLDAWLMLLEKMINPKTVLESPHALPNTLPLPSSSTAALVPFDPVRYLIQTHKKAFECVMHLWNKRPIKTYGERVSQSVLTILCHLLKGESIIADKLQKEKETADTTAAAAAGSSTGGPGRSGVPVVPAQPRRNELEEQGINVEHLQQLTDMGFARELALEALMQTNSLEQATDFLLSHPPPPARLGLIPDMEMNEEDAMAQAIAMSLGHEEAAGIDATKEPEVVKEEPKDDEPLSKELMDDFTRDILPGCLQLLDTLPETVYRVCDLLIAVSSRNGEAWLCSIFKRLIQEILDNINKLIKSTEPMTSSDKRSIQEWASEMSTMTEATKASTRLHVFSLLFEEKRNECAYLIQETQLIETLVNLLDSTHNTMSILAQSLGSNNNPTVIATPKWLAPVVLLIDLYDKAAVASVRRAPLLSLTKRQWRWFDDRSGKWTNYTNGNNKTIDDAYKAGESAIRFTAGRRKYTIQFSTMVQVNEETGSWRPIMFVTEDKSTPTAMDVTEPTAPPSGVKPETPTYKTVNGLEMAQCASLIRSSVGFISIPVEAETLHAVMRLCLRLTRNYDMASSFADLGGVRAILCLTQRSAFAGFNSLASLIIRHILEEPVTLKQTMEKVIRSTVHHSPSTFKEMNYILRVLGPAGCRDRDLFAETVRSSLRIQLPALTKREDEDVRIQAPNAVQILKLINSTVKSPVNSTPSPVIKSLICDLLNSLTVRASASPTTASSTAMTPSEETKDPRSGVTSTGTSAAVVLPVEDVDEDSENAFSPGVANDPSAPGVVIDFSKVFGPPPTSSAAAKELEAKKSRPLMTQSSLLRLLAELSKSYSVVAKIITDYTYHAGQSDLITDSDYSALAFILDNLLPSSQTIGDKDCPALSRVLISALSSCNHCPEAQTTLVTEVKAALSRSLGLTESSEKHIRIQSIANVMYTMIESCPPITPAQQQQLPPSLRKDLGSGSFNNIVKIMLKKGAVTDLAKVTHSLDLSSPHMAHTVNAVMKPLELLSRIVNTPSTTVPAPTQASSRRQVARRSMPFPSSTEATNRATAANEAAEERTIGAAINAAIIATLDRGSPRQRTDDSGRGSSNNAVNGPVDDSRSTAVEANQGQDNTSHGLTTTTSGLDGTTTSISDTNAMAADGTIDDMTDNEAAIDDVSHVDFDLTPNNVLDLVRSELDAMDAQMNESHDEQGNTGAAEDDSSNDSSDSDDDDEDDDDDSHDSDPSPRTRDEDHEEEEDEEEDVEEDDEDDDDGEGSAMMEDDEGMDASNAEASFLSHHRSDRGIDEDILLDIDEIISPAFRDLASGLIPMIDAEGAGGLGSLGGPSDPAQPSIPSNPGTVSVSHPLLIRHSDVTSALATGSGIIPVPAVPSSSILAARHSSRIPRSRFGRYTREIGGHGAFAQHHHWQHVVSSGRHHGNQPPAILNRLLGNSIGTANASDLMFHFSGGTVNNPRLILNGADFQIIATDDLGDYVESFGDPGYLGSSGLGPSSSNPMANIPSAMVRWTEESRVLDGDSMHDCVSVLRQEIIDFWEKCRDDEINERKEKRKKMIEEDERKNKEKQQNNTNNTEKESTETKVENGGVSSSTEQLAANLVQSVLAPVLGSASTSTVRFQDETQQSSQLPVVGQNTQEASPASPADPVVPMETPASIESHDGEGSVKAMSVCNESNAGSSSSTGEEHMETNGVSPDSAIMASGAPAVVTSAPDEVPDPLPVSPINLDEPSQLFASAEASHEDRDDDDDNSSEDDDEGTAAVLDFINEEIERYNVELPEAPEVHSTEETSSANQPDAPASVPTDSTATEPASGAVSSSDPEIPEGVDPSFLAALPESIRREVIAEQLRLQRQRQRVTAATTSAPPSGSSASNNLNPAPDAEINAEFLAALPPNIQEEVLAQQRLERERQAAATANPDAPVDPANFIQTLPPSLRRQVLADMDDSQIALLPGDLATEAQALRTELEQRQRQMHERFFTSHAGSTLSRILRSAGLSSGSARSGTRYAIQTLHGGANWPWNIGGPSGRGSGHGAVGHGMRSGGPPGGPGQPKFRGRLLLDHEAISCLLILLFVDEPKLNVSRLHRVLRNLSQHPPTRQWVIESLLTIMERTRENKEIEGSQRVQRKGSSSSQKIQGNPSSSWLSISLDAALGCKTNVFQVHKSATPTASKKHGSTAPVALGQGVTIHPQAAPLVSRHVLDALISLAKAFPQQFLIHGEKNEENNKITQTPSEGKQVNRDADFWDVLMRLDSLSTNKKGKSVVKTGAQDSSDISSSDASDAAPLKSILQLLSHPVIRRSAVLTDRLLRLLSLISMALPAHDPTAHVIATTSAAVESAASASAAVASTLNSLGRASTPPLTNIEPKKTEEKMETSVPTPDPKPLVGEEQLQLAVDVLTSKSCSEEGLEDVNSLLLRLSRSCPKTRDIVLKLLLAGGQQLGHTVKDNIDSLFHELKTLSNKTDEASAGPSKPTEGEDSDSFTSHKGTVQDRFTKEKVVITAPNFKPSMASKEVQLPSMATLTSKTSSQNFFLRILKVIIQLRESIRSQKKKDVNRSSVYRQLRQEVASVQAALHDLENEMAGVEQSAAATAAEGGPSASPAVEVVDRLRMNRENLAAAGATLNQAAGAVEDASQAGQQSMEVDAPVAGPSSEKKEEEEQESLSLQLSLDTLWDSLSRCLLELADAPDHHAVLVLQPAVEAFFLVHASEREPQRNARNRNESREHQLAHINADLPPPASPQASDGTDAATGGFSTSNQPALSRDAQKFLEFAETHKLVLNQILRQSTTPLVDGPFAVLVDHTRVLDFDVKRRYFRQELERLDDGVRREDLAVHVRREHVFEDSFRELYRRSHDEWKNRFYIVFEGEEGQDAGGLLREWYTIISREIFNPMYALFTTSPGDRVTYMINSSSHCNSNHLQYFKFVGRVIAKAIYDNKLLECYFTRSFYKHILGKSVKYHDMESEDYSFYQGLVFLLDHDIKELGYELTFSVEVQEFGVTEVRDLKPNGRNIPVTEDQKHEYVRLVCQEKMTGAIRKQLHAFLEGFYEIIPKRLISIFNEQETELLLSGLPNIDIDDLKSNTEYHKYQSTSLQIQWFWRALRSFDQADRAKFLQFVTGTSKVPLQGFASLEGMNGTQKFQIHRDDRSTDRLPSAHTCFNQLDLPAYETYDKLKTMLLKAVHECSEGFGFA